MCSFQMHSRIFQTTASSTKSKKSSGRPENKEQSQAFSHVIEYLDNVDYEQLTMSDLVTIMRRKLSHPEKAYSKPYMKKKLQDHYGEKIVFIEDKGIKDIICLKQTADSILRNYYNSPKSPDPNIQKKQLIETAAQLIKNDIKEMGSNKDTYPDIVPEDMLSYLPDSLVCLLTNVCQGKNVSLKRCSHWTGTCTVRQTQNSFGTITVWTRCTTAQGVRIKISH